MHSRCHFCWIGLIWDLWVKAIVQLWLGSCFNKTWTCSGHWWVSIIAIILKIIKDLKKCYFNYNFHTVRTEDLLAFLLKNDFFLTKAFSTSSSTVKRAAGDSREAELWRPLGWKLFSYTNRYSCLSVCLVVHYSLTLFFPFQKKYT